MTEKSTSPSEMPVSKFARFFKVVASEKLTNILTTLAIVLPVVIGGLAYIWAEADTKIAKRLKPYEDLFAAVTLASEEGSTQAVISFRQVLDGLGDDKVSDTLAALISRRSICSIAFMKGNIGTFAPDFARFLKLTERGVRTPQLDACLSMYYLRQRNLDLARDYGLKAISGYQNTLSSNGAAVAHYNLIYVELAAGDVSAAVDHCLQSQTLDQNRCDPWHIILNKPSQFLGSWADEYNALYPGYETRVQQFINALAAKTGRKCESIGVDATTYGAPKGLELEICYNPDGSRYMHFVPTKSPKKKP
jgi:tetratricopeptide (TPR) repeat protein